MDEVTIIGIDLAKNVFQLHGGRDGRVRKKLSRPQFHRFMSEHPRCVVAMEACGGASSHSSRQKNDAADAEAIVEAARRPTMRFVEPKTGNSRPGPSVSAPASSS